MTMIQLLVNGIAAGAQLALMAMGFGLIYSALKFFHVAHGAIYVCGGYALYGFHVQAQWPIGLAVVGAVGVAALAGLLAEQVVFGPLATREASGSVLLISSLGLDLFLVNALALVFGSVPRTVDASIRVVEIVGIRLTAVQLLQIACCALVGPLLLVFLSRSRLGLGMLALADNPTLFHVLGGDRRRIRLSIFALGSALAGLAAALAVLDGGVDPSIGTIALLQAAVAVILGGVGRIDGAILGAFVIGIVGELVTLPLSANWQSASTFALLILALLWRPQGLLAPRRRVEEL